MNTSASPLEVACRISDLAEYLDVDQSDNVLGIVAMQAAAMAVEFLESDLISRDRVTTYQEWPTTGTVTNPSLSPQAVRPLHDIELPYANLEPGAVVTVSAYGESVTDFELQETKPATIHLSPSYALSSDHPALVISYRSGFGPFVDDVPSHIQYGIIMLAAFLLEHRGNCDADQAMRRSGAAGQLFPYRLRAVRL